MSIAAPTSRSSAGVLQKGLKAGAIGLVSSVVIGVASTAPAYSLTATLGLVAQQARTRSPIIMLLAFVPMLFISYAYKALNAADPDCGTSFTWVARAFGRHLGWMVGWAIVVADVIVMANLAEVAGIYTFDLFGAGALAGSRTAVLVAGSIWILLMTVVAWLGIEMSARTQFVLLGIEIAVLAGYAVVALLKVATGNGAPGSIPFSWSWFNPAGGGMTLSALSAALLLAVFIYWGWDSAVAINEETRNARITPGRAAVISTVVLLVTYVLVTVATQSYAGVGSTGSGLANPANTRDVLSGLGTDVLGGWGGKLLILAVLSSAAASTQTTILPTARTTLSMAAVRALPRAFGDTSRRFMTPTVSTWAMGGVSIAFYVVLTVARPAALGDLIASIGLLIAFYYGLTGLASAWYFRHQARDGWRPLLERILLPLLGGLILLGAFGRAAYDYYAPGYGETTFFGVGGVFVLGVGSLVLGIVLMIIWNVLRPAYFTGRTMPPDLIAAGPDTPPAGQSAATPH